MHLEKQEKKEEKKSFGEPFERFSPESCIIRNRNVRIIKFHKKI